MKRIWIYLKEYKKECVFAPLFKMLEALFELFVPLVVASIIDVGIAQRDSSYIIKMCIMLIALAIIGLVCAITAQYFAAKAAVGCATGLRHHLFKHIQGMSFTEMDTIGTSTLITRMTSDINQVQNGVNLVLRLFLRSPFIVFGAMIMAFTIDFNAALVFAATIPVLAIVVFGIILSTSPMYKNVQARLDKVLGITRQNLTGVRVIRAFNRQQDEIENFKNANEKLNRLQKFVGKISGLMNPLTYVIINMAIVILLWTGAVRVNEGSLTQGQVVALYNYMSQILVELIKLANLVISVTKALACANRIDSVFAVKSGMKDGQCEISGNEGINNRDTNVDNHKNSDKDNIICDNIVEFKNVSLKYERAGAESLTDISFTVKKGQTVGIIGGTGSGKSSLVNLIPRFYDVDSGRILIDGHDIRDITLKSLRENIGVVQQDVYLFAGTIFDNIAYGRFDASYDDVIEAAKKANAHEFIMSLPDKYNTDIGQRGVKLSGGQKQRISIARVFLKNPSILIFDEATSALDNESERVVQESLEKLAENRTTFVIAHRLSTIRNAKNIMVLTEEGIAEQGSHNELIEKDGIYKKLYDITVS